MQLSLVGPNFATGDLVASNDSPCSVEFTTDPARALKGASLVLVATKRGANAEVASTLAKHCPTAPVLLCQNGLGAAAEVPGAYQCVVTVNVVSDPASGVFTRTSPLPKLAVDAALEASAPGAVPALRRAGFAVYSLPTATFSDSLRWIICWGEI